MRFCYSTSDPSHNVLDRLPQVLLPALARQLGAAWEDRKAVIRLAGNLGSFPAMPLSLMAVMGEMPAVNLVFAWIQTESAPLILGQMNFFMEFEVCFYRSSLEFEVKVARP